MGINVIFYYSNVLWQAVGFGESDALAISLIANTTNVLTTLIAIALVDRFGRKPLLLAGSVGMTVSLGAMAWALSGAGAHGALGDVQGTVALLAARVFVFAFGFSWGPMVWVLDQGRRAGGDVVRRALNSRPRSRPLPLTPSTA